MRLLLLLLLVSLSAPAFAQATLLVEGPDGFSLEAINDVLTAEQQRAVDDGRAVVVTRQADGWCLGCDSTHESHPQNRVDRRARAQRTGARGHTTETSRVDHGGSYRALLTFDGTLDPDDSDLAVINLNPALSDLRVNTFGGQTRVQIALDFKEGESLDDRTEAALDALHARAAQTSTSSTSSSSSSRVTVTN